MADAKGAYIGGVPVQFKDAAARAMISDEYNSAETYAKGNLCIYNGKIYEAIKETTGTWDATAWEETTLAEVNAKMRSDITNLTENMVPDMSKMAPIITSSKDVNNKAYTIAEDGYITASVRTQGTSGSPFIRINIGGTNLYEGQGMSGMYKYLWSSVIPVRKGMKITFTLTAGENITDAQYNVWFFK